MDIYGYIMDMPNRILLNDRIPSELAKLLAEIDEFRGRWESLKNIAPDRLSVLRKVATIASIGSSTRIEGARLSDAQVEELLSHVSRHAFRNRDEEEVAGYSDAMNLVFDSFPDIPITENHIKQLHGILLKYSSKDARHKGEYKKLPNHLEAYDPSGRSLGVVFETATPFKTPLLMASLVEWYHRETAEKNHHPLLVIGAFIVHFLAIHPFQDGNGRLSRVLTTLMLLQQRYEHASYCSLESIIEDNKDRYYLALRKAQTSFESDHSGMEEWLRFFLVTLKKQKDILAQKMEKEKILSTQGLPEIDGKLLALIRKRGRMTVSDAVEKTGANRNTVKKHLQALVVKKLIQQHGVGKGTWYSG
jgi:Fic family protein